MRRVDMNDTDLMKLMDLSGELGLVLEMNPIWKKEYVIYGGNLDDAYIMCLSLDNGHWEIVTKIYGARGVLNLSQEAIALMGKMSKLVKGKEE